MEEHRKRQWESFCRLGEMIGDGDHEKWVEVEYRKLMKILVPPTEEEKKIKSENRRNKNENINQQIENKLKIDKCPKCNSEMKQTRGGSKVVQCTECKAKYQYKVKK